MQKLKTFFRRVQSMSLKRMFYYAKKASADCGRPAFFIVVDMVWCAARFGVGYLDYLIFGFGFVRGKKRRTFMTMNHNLRLVKLLNDPQYSPIFENKLLFCERFNETLGREWIDAGKASDEQFAAFLADKTDVFAKQTEGFGGLGVKHIAITPDTKPAALRAELVAGGFLLVEQQIAQHDTMNLLCSETVNTIRMVTVLKDGEVHVMYCLVRMGRGNGTKVDNISSGGMYAPVSFEGVITAPAFCDKTGEYYEQHPATGVTLPGFQIPMFPEALSLVRCAAQKIPQVRYIGWDVAIAKTGPTLVEGNTIPAYDMCQNYHHLPGDKTGVLPRFTALLGREI